MALSHSPRKLVPLTVGDERPSSSRFKPTQPRLTRRVFFCGVVVENAEHGQELSPDVQDLVASLGDPLDLGLEASPLPPSNSSTTDLSQASNEPHRRKRATTITNGTNDSPSPTGSFTRKRANTVSSGLTDILNELVATERSYVKRLRTLKTDYADPLRTFSKNKDTAIIPPYEAKTLFGNIDQLLPVNEAFLEDLEKMSASDGHETVGGVGDVALKHFKELKGFENYKQYYAKREEAQQIFEREMRKGSGFSGFVDRIKYSSTEARNRVGLRELLMDPVQRIPRYTLMFRTMIKHMALNDPQRAKLLEADEIASKIALAETDEQTKRAAIMYCLSSTVDDFPPNLVSNSRKFIDCIDVEDVVVPSPDSHLSSSGAGPSGSSSSGSSLHCSLFLFDDKLVILKRPGDKGARTLTGLDDLDKVTKGKSMSLNSKKTGMSCKGVVEVTDVVATDVGGADFHLYLEYPPMDQTDRWSGRPFRALSVVNPPAPINLDPTRTSSDKARFLENLWSVQARYRTRLGQSVILCGEEREVENRGGKVTMARTYFNVYQRTAFMKESKKAKIVVHIDPLGSADPIPFGTPGPPFVVVRIQPMAGELARYTVESSDLNDEGEEDILQIARVPNRIVQTIHQFGLFKFRTGNQSVPNTPTASTRSRAAIFGLDAISRNLFHNRTGSTRGDIFGGSMSAHKRSKTTASRSSAYTQSTGTAESSLSRVSSRSRNSTFTLATSVEDDGMSLSGSVASRNSRRQGSLTKAKKLIKRHKSPMSGGSGSEPEAEPTRCDSRLSQLSRARSPSSDWYTDNEDAEDQPKALAVDQSERDLVARLELARQNSRSQSEPPFPDDEPEPVQEPVYDDEPPRPVRSRASRDLPEIPGDSPRSSRAVTPQPEGFAEDSRRSRTLSTQSESGRPRGPRTPSPLPPPRTPDNRLRELPSSTDDLEETLVSMSQLAVTPKPSSRRGPSPIPRSKRQPFDVISVDAVTPRPGSSKDDSSRSIPTVEPLSIKRKPSLAGLNGHRRRVYNVGRGSPMTKPTGRVTSLRRTSSQLKSLRMPSMDIEEAQQLVAQAEAAKNNVDAARRHIRRLRQHYEQMSAGGESDRAISPVKGLRTSQRATPPPMTKEARARMEEMQRLIGRRAGGEPSRPRPLSMATESSLPRLVEYTRAEEVARSMDEDASHVDADLLKAVQHLEVVHGDLEKLTSTLTEKSDELEKTKNDLSNSKLQCAFLKQLYDNSIAEKDAMYDAFNEELEGMFNDAVLPEDEAWAAMTRDLTETKKARTEMERENLQLRRDLEEAMIQKEAWGALLRNHGLIQ